MAARTALLALALVASGACGEDTPGPLDASSRDSDLADLGVEDAGVDDAGIEDAGVERVIELGTGFMRWEPLVENQEVPLILGPQSLGDRMGGFHIFVGFRSRRLDPELVRAEFVVEKEGAAEPLGQLTRNFRMEPSPDADDWYWVYGATLILRDCCAAAGANLTLSAEATDANGLVGTDSLHLVGGPTCTDRDGEDVCL